MISSGCQPMTLEYILTTVLLQSGCPEKREVRQFQFTAWPDHGVPDHPTPLLLFMRRVKAMTPPDTGPMVTHCRYITIIFRRILIISMISFKNILMQSQVKSLVICLKYSFVIVV